ncbi:hypothetical protein PN462_07985 [Spirulina sp. CS-785/01]|uniref:hypothetical protein n=1 Tax=Spirulina sp. CS-785/01 TaxID=3021716 RepID=UPI00232F535A|nr:hypothetical protein [Spirulina sp. CS-785/01]MDB9313038.1 hypothetical protein [Spirulina sp. CS-785/01]
MKEWRLLLKVGLLAMLGGGELLCLLGGGESYAQSSFWTGRTGEAAILAQFPSPSLDSQAIPSKKPQQLPPVTATPEGISYNPQPLSRGYAVLVNYFNNPQIAQQVETTIDQEVGLVVYFGRPYLLATYTDNVETASGILQELSDRGFSAMMVNSERVILLTPQVQLSD